MSKEPEIILVTRNTASLHLDVDDYIHLIEHDNEAWKDEAIRNASFVERWMAERDKSIVQFIPYVVCLTEEGNILSYKRKGGGEQRLEGKHSVGIGGHVNTTDTKTIEQLIPDQRKGTQYEMSWDVVTRGAIREIEEELRIDKGYAEDNLVEVGVMYTPTDEGLDDQTPIPAVGEVHIAIIYALKVHDKVTTQASEGLIRPRFIKGDTISRKNYEKWSQLILSNLDEIKRIHKSKSTS